MFATIIGIFGTIKALLAMAALGAATGGASWVAARLFPGMGGLAAACVIGGAVVIGSGGAGFMTATSNCANQAKLNELRFEKARVEQELAAQKAAAVVQDEVLTEQAAKLEENAKVLGLLDEIIVGHADADECVLFPDELEAIRTLE